jgi:hypothetical protein
MAQTVPAWVQIVLAISAPPCLTRRFHPVQARKRNFTVTASPESRTRRPGPQVVGAPRDVTGFVLAGRAASGPQRGLVPARLDAPGGGGAESLILDERPQRGLPLARWRRSRRDAEPRSPLPGC